MITLDVKHLFRLLLQQGEVSPSAMQWLLMLRVGGLLQVDGVRDVESNNALESGTLIVAADPDTLIRNLMEAVRRLVCLPLGAWMSCSPCLKILAVLRISLTAWQEV